MMAARHHATRQRQIVRALFIPQPKVATCTPPLRAVRCDPAPAGTLVCEKMREFVTKRALDFGIAKFTQPGIQPHERTPRKREARRGAQPRIPLHPHAPGQRHRAYTAKQSTRFGQQRVLLLGNHFHDDR